MKSSWCSIMCNGVQMLISLTETTYRMLVYGNLKHVSVSTVLQKVYLFGAEGTTQDRGRARPAPAAASLSPAKRAKTCSQQDDAAGEQQTCQDAEDREEEQCHQAERESEASEMADKDPSSTSKHSTAQSMQCPFPQLLIETHEYRCGLTCQCFALVQRCTQLRWHAKLAYTLYITSEQTATQAGCL